MLWNRDSLLKFREERRTKINPKQNKKKTTHTKEKHLVSCIEVDFDNMASPNIYEQFTDPNSRVFL